MQGLILYRDLENAQYIEQKIKEREELRKAYISEIEKLDKQFPFNWFCTLTFEQDIHPEQAEKRYRRWIHKLNRAIFGCNYYKRKWDGVVHVYAVERQKRGTLHLHALISRIPKKHERRNPSRNLKRAHWKEEWRAMGNGIARIEAYKKDLGARYYLSKYLLKGGEITFSENIPVLRGFLGLSARQVTLL